MDLKLDGKVAWTANAKAPTSWRRRFVGAHWRWPRRTLRMHTITPKDALNVRDGYSAADTRLGHLKALR